MFDTMECKAWIETILSPLFDGHVLEVVAHNLNQILANEYVSEHSAVIRSWPPIVLFMYSKTYEPTIKEQCHHQSPEDEWTCTRTKGHEGLHIGHFAPSSNRVMAEVCGVWEESSPVIDDLLSALLTNHLIGATEEQLRILRAECSDNNTPCNELADWYCKRPRNHTGLHCAFTMNHGKAEGSILSIWE